MGALDVCPTPRDMKPRGFVKPWDPRWHWYCAYVLNFSTILPRPTSSTYQKVDQMRDKTCPLMGLWSPPPPSSSKSRITVTWGQRHHAYDTATVANEGISAFPNALGHGKPFLSTFVSCYFCVDEGPVSSISCRHEPLIVSCPCVGNDRRHAIGSYQWHFDGSKCCF